MGTILADDDVRFANPLDAVEEIVSAQQWSYDRHSEQELSVCVAGTWGDLHLGFSCCDGHRAMQIACAYDLHVPPAKLAAIYPLLAQINERLFLGHFDIWSEDRTPMFRHAVLLRDDSPPPQDQLESLIEIAVSECERFYPALQLVLWGGKSAEEAVMVALLDTVGEA